MARKTKAEAAATREALLDAAEDMFFTNGVARTSLEQIARHAGVTRGAVYWHFKNKAELFRALLERVSMPFQSLMAEVNNTSPDVSPLEAIRLACHAGLSNAEQPSRHRILSILIHRCEFFSDINPLEMQDEIVAECQSAMLVVFEQAHEQGQLSEELSPTVAAQLLQSTMGGLFHDWLRSPDKYSIQERGGAIINGLIGLMRR